MISKKLELFYNQASEETRLETVMGAFEFERVKYLIQSHVSKPKSVILDVGGGTGKYSEWLAKMGHAVKLIEPIEKHLKTARKRSAALANRFTVEKGVAQRLNVPNNTVDIVILHGPLYHLQDKNERLQCIREAKRVLKKDGIILGFAINYTASTIVGLLNGYIHSQPYLKMCNTELKTGLHSPPKEFPFLMTDSYYHNPQQLREEFTSQGLHCLNIYAVEGMAWLDANFMTNIVKPNTKTTLLDLLKATETDPNLLAFSPHIMIVGGLL